MKTPSIGVACPEQRRGSAFEPRSARVRELAVECRATARARGEGVFVVTAHAGRYISRRARAGGNLNRVPWSRLAAHSSPRGSPARSPSVSPGRSQWSRRWCSTSVEGKGDGMASCPGAPASREPIERRHLLFRTGCRSRSPHRLTPPRPHHPFPGGRWRRASARRLDRIGYPYEPPPPPSVTPRGARTRAGPARRIASGRDRDRTGRRLRRWTRRSRRGPWTPPGGKAPAAVRAAAVARSA